MRYVAFFTLVLIFIFLNAFAGIVYVPNDTTSIQGGIHLASHGDTVLVANGTYYENINFKGKAITVASHFLLDGDTSHISNTIIDGSQPSNPDSGSVVYFVSGENSNTMLEGFTITGGTGTIATFQGSLVHGGGGIFVDSSSCIIRYNKIIANSLSFRGFDCGGAGIGIQYSDCIIENNIIRHNIINEPNNWAGGGGLYIDGKSVSIRNNIISDNTITSNWGPGAGVTIYQFSNSDTIYFEDNIVEHNIYNSSQLAAGGGLGILYCKGPVIVTGNRIAYNESHGSASHLNGEAGGIYIENCSPIITNNIISSNNTGHGGGITVCYYSGFEPQAARPLIINNTLSKNIARENGGGICSYGEYAHPTIINTLLWGDTAAGQPNEIFNFLAGRMTMLYSNIEGGWSGTGNISQPPHFADELCHLSDSSGCIGFGRRSITIGSTTYLAPLTDYDGDPRPSPIDTMVDIGADESPFGAWAQLQASIINHHQSYIHPSQDSLHIGVKILNPHHQGISLSTRVTNLQGALWDEFPLFDDGMHGDSAAGDLFYGNVLPPVMVEEFFRFNHKIVYQSNQNSLVFPDKQQVTSAGPVIWETCQVYPATANRFPLRLRMRNLGQLTAADAVRAEIIPKDSWVTRVISNNQPFGTILAGDTASHGSPYYVETDTSGYPGYFTFDVIISSNGYPYWYQQDFTVGIERSEDNLPRYFALYQNYPNPFNPITTIKFALPRTSPAKLKIYNIMGEEVNTLLSSSLPPGFHTVEFDASDLASGIYIYRLQAGSYSETKKMVVLK